MLTIIMLTRTVLNVLEENTYNGFNFRKVEGNLWVVRIDVRNQPYDIPFYHHPKDTLTVLKDRTATEPVFKGPKEIVISVDPDAGSRVVIAGVEIARLTGSKYNLYNIPTSSALSKSTGENIDLPVVSCKDATEERTVIQFVQGKQNLIIRSDNNPNCVLLQYTTPQESIRVADRYAYMLLKIMY